MNEWHMRQVLDEFLDGQQEAMAALTVALSRVVDREALAEQLRIQLTTYPAHERANPVRHALLLRMWESIRYPSPPPRDQR